MENTPLLCDLSALQEPVLGMKGKHFARAESKGQHRLCQPNCGYTAVLPLPVGLNVFMFAAPDAHIISPREAQL